MVLLQIPHDDLAVGPADGKTTVDYSTRKPE